jgi:predicted acyltransferase
MKANLLPATRNTAVDVFRGFVMFLMMAEVLEFHKVAEALPISSFWQFMAFHQSHVPWVGCSLHDLIQPSFSFLVGVALPFSVASRIKKGGTFLQIFLHALKRSLILILLGVFLRSFGREITYWTFEDTLTQIGLGYPFLFLLGFRNKRFQLATFIVLVVGYFVAFVLYPLPNAGFDYAAVGVPSDWTHDLSGFAAHWNKNSNLAWVFDTWFMNLFPRENFFTHNGGGYVTLSFIPTLATMVLGLFAGNWLREEKDNQTNLKRFLITGMALLVVGFLLDITGICPNVKRIWTPTWVIFSGGWCFLLLALFHFMVDMKGKANWFYFLNIIGLNSIAAYVLAHTIISFIDENVRTNISQNYDLIFGPEYHTLVSGFLILLFEWLILRWMFKKKLFVKI